MTIQPLSKQQICDIYAERIARDFLKDEVKPLDAILALYDSGNYNCFGAYRENRILAYAFVAQNDDCALLDYFAVAPKMRRKGFGSEFIRSLASVFFSRSPLIFEVERISSAENEQDKLRRRKRVNFYLKNGAVKTGVETTIFGVDYSIMYFKTCGDLSDAEIKTRLREIYKMMLGQERFEKYAAI